MRSRAACEKESWLEKQCWVFSHICIDYLFYYIPPYFFMVVQDDNWCIGGSVTHLTPSHAEKACSSINKLSGTMVSYFIPSTILVILANLESYWWFLCLLNFNYIEIISILLTDLPDQLQRSHWWKFQYFKLFLI